MNTSSLAPRSKFLLFCTALVMPSMAIASDVVLQKAPPLTVQQAPAYPENVARYHFGAAVQSLPRQSASGSLRLSSNGEDQNTSDAALLCDDPTIGYQLPAGQSTILVSLARIENLQSVSLLNSGAQGSLTIATSNADVPANSPEWHQVEQCAISQGAVTAKVGPSEAKYVRLTFDIKQPGRIAAFGLFVTPAVSDFTMPRPRKVDLAADSSNLALVDTSFTDLHLRARGLYASSGDLTQVNKMIDGQPGTTYRFAANDSAPTAMIDLGRERTLSRISAIFAAQPGSIDFYVLDSLPKGAAADTSASDPASIQKISNVTQGAGLPEKLELNDQTLTALKPVGSAVITTTGRAAVDFPATKGRYLMLKWHPASVENGSFAVAQVAAFGRHKTVQDAGASEANEASSDNNGMVDEKDFADGKSILDNKDIPAEGPAEARAPAEGPPPALPEVPPFTFIPQTVPEVPPISP